MKDLASFESATFNAKTWVNATCAKRSEAEPLERYLAELETRFHLAVEDLDASLEDDSTRALQRVPAAVQEISHIKGDVASLKAEVDRVLRTLEASAAAAERSVSLITQADRAKARMEEACSTLKEATELAELFNKVDSIFASGNLQRMASLLETMRRCLSLVGNVPEFEGGLQRLEDLEHRFHSIVEPQLASALSEGNGDKVQQLATYLASIQQAESVKQLYVSARINTLQRLWDSWGTQANQHDLAQWLPTFFDDLISAVESELNWSASNLPEQYPEAILQLLTTFFARIDKSCRKRMEGAFTSGGLHGSLGTLAKLQATAESFVQALRRHLLGVHVEHLLPLLTSIYAPFEAHLARYGELEARQLAAEMEAIDLPGPLSSSTDTVVAGLKAAVPTAVALCHAAADRCRKISQGTELQILMLVTDDVLQELFGRLMVRLRQLQDQTLSASQPQSSLEEAQALLPLLTVAGSLQSRISLLDARLRSEAVELRPLLEVAAAGLPADLSPAVLRLRREQGRRLEQLKAFLATVEGVRYSALPNAAASVAIFSEAAHQLIYELLTLKLKAELAVVPGLPSWHAAEPESKLNLPSFNVYPQAYATAAGEYLMMLPQLLESLLIGPDSEPGEQAQIDADWLDKVAAGAANLYAAKLQQVPVLSPQGSQQLTADLEYFCNVLSALGVTVPAALATWQLACGWSQEEFPDAARAANKDGLVDSTTLATIAKVRQLSVQL